MNIHFAFHVAPWLIHGLIGFALGVVCTVAVVALGALSGIADAIGGAMW
jgi:hypothetical protein